MPTKRYRKDRRTCQVTFTLPPEVAAASAHLCGEFNDWSTASHPMKRAAEGGFELAVPLDAERSYRYRFLLDGDRWENDWAAERYEPNEFGSDDAVVDV